MLEQDSFAFADHIRDQALVPCFLGEFRRDLERLGDLSELVRFLSVVLLLYFYFGFFHVLKHTRLLRKLK